MAKKHRQRRASSLDEEIDRLYGLPLEQFIEKRDALVKRRRQEGARDDADRIKKLRKPSTAAWAVNQLIREEPALRDRLLEAADALREAQEALATGKADTEQLRRATEGERAAIEALVERAKALQEDGRSLSQTTLERVQETLHATALDPEARQQVEDARLTRELSAVGFGLVGTASPAKSDSRSKKQAPPKRSKKGATEKQKRAEVAARRKEIQTRLRGARQTAKKDKEALSAARREAKRATTFRDQAQRQLDGAEVEVSEAEGRLRTAQQEIQQEEQRLGEL